MTSKQQIDEYFNKNYDKLLLNIKKIAKNARQTNFKPEDLLSLSYQHLLTRLNKLTEEKIEVFFIRYVERQIKWKNSELYRLFSSKNIVMFENVTDNIEDAIDDYMYKVYKEKEYNEKKIILYDFVKTLTIDERIFYESMYDENFKTVSITKLKEKFKINRNHLTEYRKSLKQKEQEFINKHYKR